MTKTRDTSLPVDENTHAGPASRSGAEGVLLPLLFTGLFSGAVATYLQHASTPTLASTAAIFVLASGCACTVLVSSIRRLAQRH